MTMRVETVLSVDFAGGFAFRTGDTARRDAFRVRTAFRAPRRASFSQRPEGSALRQQPTLSCLLEPLPEHVLGVHHFGEAGAVDFHGRDDRGRAGFGVTIAHTVVGIL